MLLAGILLVSVSCENVTSSIDSTSSSSSSSSSEEVHFTKDDYGEMFGKFFSSNATLSIEENQAR